MICSSLLLFNLITVYLWFNFLYIWLNQNSPFGVKMPKMWPKNNTKNSTSLWATLTSHAIHCNTKPMRPSTYAQSFTYPRLSHVNSGLYTSIITLERVLNIWKKKTKAPTDVNQDHDVGVSLYSKKVLILAKANQILPRWLRFLKGVVDSEDIPLNLSRELLQDSNLIKRMRTILTQRILKFLNEVFNIN